MTVRRAFLGLAAGAASGGAAMAVRTEPETLRPMTLTPHRFDILPDRQARAREWIADKDVLVPGSHARIVPRTALMPDFIVAAIRRHQKVAER